MTPSIEEIQAAEERIRPYVVRTPLEPAHALSELVGVEVWLKLECFQRTGSFKVRGALNTLLQLGPAERSRGVITASAGNHALGLAEAARVIDVRATVVLPETASLAKIEALRRTGATLLLHGAQYDAAEAEALRLSEAEGAVFVSAYNDAAVIAGGGTVGLEIVEDLPSARTLIVPVGGGGLISGIALAATWVENRIRIVGVQSEASPALHAALAAGRVVPVAVEPSLADGLAGNIEPGSITVDLMRQWVAEVVLVKEAAIAHAMRFLLEQEHVLVEGSAAVGVAALLEFSLEQVQGPLVVVLTGRNVAATVLRQHVLA